MLHTSSFLSQDQQAPRVGITAQTPEHTCLTAERWPEGGPWDRCSNASWSALAPCYTQPLGAWSGF